MNEPGRSSGDITRQTNAPPTDHQRLYDQFGAMAYGVILQIIPQKKLAQEVLLDVFASPQLLGNLSNSTNPAIQIIRLTRAKALAAREKATELGIHFSEPTLTTNEFSPAYVFDLSFRQGYSLEAIAEQLGVSKPEVLKAIREYIHTFRQS